MITLTESLKQNAVFGKLKCLISNNIINHINQIILIYLVIMFDWRPGFIGHEQILVGHPMTESYFQLCRRTKQGNEAGKSRGYRVGTSLSVVITRISYLIWRPLNQKKIHFLRYCHSIHNSQGFGLAVPCDPFCPNVALWYPASRGSSLAWFLTLTFTKSISSLDFVNVKSHAKDKPRLAR